MKPLTILQNNVRLHHRLNTIEQFKPLYLANTAGCIVKVLAINENLFLTWDNETLYTSDIFQAIEIINTAR